MDKRITLAAFKQNLEPYVGVASTQFKVFRVYGNNQEFESVRLTETLSSFSVDNKVSIHLNPGNVRFRFFLFCFLVCCTDFYQCFDIFFPLIDNYSTRKSTEKG